MKKSILFILFVIMATAAYSQLTTVSGSVSYKNAFSTPMSNSTVELLQGGVVIYSAITDSTGNYQINLVAPGNYTIKVTTQKPAGGMAASDGLSILRHFVGMPPLLTGLNLLAADCNHDGYYNAIDGLFISRRFVGQISTFPAGDWIFEQFTISVNGSPLVQHIKALCFGDTNGSYIPPTNP